jgi:putative resolvase
MNRLYRISEAATLLGVCAKTIRRWDHAGQITCQRTAGGHRRISLLEITRLTSGDRAPQSPPPLSSPGATAIYGRVSSHEQKVKGDLTRQIDTAKEYCASKHLTPTYLFTDISSGLNVCRPGLIRLCTLIERGTIAKVILTYPDRLTRFGFAYLERYFQSHGTAIHAIHRTPSTSMEEELVQDLIAIITSFSGRVHGLRSHKNGKKTGNKRRNP